MSSLKEKASQGCFHCSCCSHYHGIKKGCDLPKCAFVPRKLLDDAQKEIESLFALLPISYNKFSDDTIEIHDIGKRKHWIKFLEKFEERRKKIKSWIETYVDYENVPRDEMRD